MMVTDCLKDEDEKDVVFFKLKKAVSLHPFSPINPSVPFFFGMRVSSCLCIQTIVVDTNL